MFAGQPGGGGMGRQNAYVPRAAFTDGSFVGNFVGNIVDRAFADKACDKDGTRRR